MDRTLTRRLAAGLPFLVALVLGSAGPAGAAALPRQDADTQKANGTKDEKEKPKWDVQAPPGEWRTILIDSQETTWSNVDVSPDGRTIVFDALGDLFTVPIEGGDARALTEGIAWDIQPRYSPDGKRIAYISDRGGAENLWVVKADGTDARAITEEKTNLVHNPWWSRDGQYIAARKGFTSTRSIAAGEIWLFHAGGGEGLQLVERPNGPKDQKNIAEPSLSPDGRYLYFSQDTTPGRIWQYNKDSTGQIFVIRRLDRETGLLDTVADGPGGAIRPTPSPDGKRLAYVRRTPAFTSAIHVKDLTSGLDLHVFDQLDRDLQEANGSQGNTPAISWTPDGRSIVFWAGGRIRRVDVESRKATVIPVRIRSSMKTQPALRFPVTVAPDQVPVKMLRWAQHSPDGSRVVFQALGYLYVKDLKTGRQKRLTGRDDAFELYPSFSRDGRQIVYVAWSDETLGSIRVVPATGGTSREVTRTPGHYLEPRFSPDGRRITYRKVTGGYLTSAAWSLEPGVYVIPTEGGDPKRISRSGFAPHFGADPDRVWFSDIVEDTQRVLKSVDLDGHEERTHLKGAQVTEFAVSPDGRWVGFTENYNAYVAPFTRTGKTVEIGAKSKALPVRQVSKRSGEFLHWSADSARMHWSHGPTLYSRELKDAFAFLDGSPEKLPEPVEEGLDLAFSVPADAPSGRIALTGARVITMRNADINREVIENAVVLVRGNRIERVGPAASVPIPPDAKRVDISGMTIIPGMIDVHAHGAQAIEEIVPQQNWTQYSSIAFGVTTIHDPSNDTSEIFAASEMQRAGLIVGPRVYSTGTILYGATGPGYHAAIDSLEDARFLLQRLKDVGAISVKSYNQPRRDQRQQVLAAGRELGLMVVPEGGSKVEQNMTMVVDGHTGVEHAIPVATGYDDLLQLWSKTSVGYTPTFVVAYGGLSGETYWYDRTEVWKDDLLMRYVPRFVVEPQAIRRTTAPDLHYNHFHVARFAKQLRDRGVSVQIGAHGQREGLAAHWELWMMAQGGFTPWEALRGATIDGARYLGMDRDLGSVEAGKLADLVILKADPLEDIRRSEQIAYTMINGRLYEAATMNQVAPVAVSRRPFFFEKEGGDTLPMATREWLDALRVKLGWVH